MSLFYEWGLKALPEGSDSPSRLGMAAKQLGYDGIIICNHTGFENIIRPEAALEVKNIDVAFGAEVSTSNPRAMRAQVAALRSRYPFIAVHGTSEEMNRSACEDPNVDVLIHHPENGKHILEIAAVRAAKLNQVAIGFDLSPMMRLRGCNRSRWLDSLRRNLGLIRKFDLNIMLTIEARSHFDLRSPRDLLALAGIAGFEPSEAEDALRLPARILELNRRNWAGPGVEIL